MHRASFIGLFACLLAPCQVSNYGVASAAPFPPPKRVYILSPDHMVRIQPGGKIPLRLRITELGLAMKEMGGKNVPGHGHYHFYVDCIPPNAYYVANLGGCWAGADATLDTVFDLSTSHVKVTSGTHLLFIALSRNNHVLYRVPAATLVFTITGGVKTIHLVSPLGAATVKKNGRLPISVRVTGITMAMNEMGRAHVPGRGHYHFYIDCIPADAYTKPDLSTCWAGASADLSTSFDLASSHVKVGPGRHRLILALARNDHILYRAPTAALTLIVKKAG